MAAMSDYLENKLLDHVLGEGSRTYTEPAAVYVALFTSASSAAELEAGTLNNEVTGGNYARQEVTFTAASAGATSNSGAITWTDMPAVTIAYVGVVDAATGGNILFKGALAASKTLNSGDTFTINTGDLDISLD